MLKLRACNLFRDGFNNILAAMVGMEYVQFTKQECILLQLDLSKAYDWITWSFVSDVLQRFGFGTQNMQLHLHNGGWELLDDSIQHNGGG